MSLFSKRRVAKWTGLVACALIAIVYVGGRAWPVHWVGSRFQFAVGRGEVRLLYGALNGNYYISEHGVGWMRSGHGLPSGWSIRRPAWRGKPVWFGHFVHGKATYFSTSLLVPLLVIAIPTAWLWRRERRYPPGHCRNCGYDLTGNVTGVCSECGRGYDQAKGDRRT